MFFVCNNGSINGSMIPSPNPYDRTDNMDERKRKRKSVDFVKLKPAHWEPIIYTGVFETLSR